MSEHLGRRAPEPRGPGRRRTPSTPTVARARPGRARRSRGASSASPRRRSGRWARSTARRRRARLRHRVRLRLARAPRRAAGRRRRDARPARDGATLPGGVRARVPARRGERRGRPAPVRELRPRRLRVRRQHLVRPAPLAPRGVPAPPARRPALVPPQQHALDPLRTRRGGPPGVTLLRPQRGHGAHRVARRDRGRVAASARRALPAAAAHGLRRRRPRRALRARRRRRPRVLRGVLGRVGAQVAGRGDLGRGEAG